MRKMYRDGLAKFAPERWQVSDRELNEQENKCKESIFTVANGFIGVRGFFEEGFYGAPENTDPAVMLNGVFEYHDHKYAWKRPGFASRNEVITRQANPLDVVVWADGEPVKMTEKGYERTLNFQNGVLTRRFLFTSKAGKRAELTFERFACQHDANLLACRVEVRALDALDVCVVGTLISADSGEKTAEGEDAVYLPVSLTRSANVAAALYRTRRSGFLIACAVRETLQGASCTVCDGAQALVTRSSLTLRAGESAIYERIACFYTDRQSEDPLAAAQSKVENAAAEGFSSLLKKSRKVLGGFWRYSDIVIDDDPLVQQGVRFSAFQVFQSAGRDGFTNISANGLSGTIYSGQTFWDTEMYMMPMFTYGDQRISRDLLMYRYHLLDKSRERARQMEEQGALYSWNTIDGEECGMVFEAATAQYHINADIAYALEKYYDASGDEQFLVEYGAEMLFEMSKCLSHRGNFIEARGGKFCINVICGPDEYNPVVDNNLYTNMLVQKMFAFTLRVKELLAQKYPQKLAWLTEKCGMDESEFSRIERAREHMYLPYNEEYGIYMQDDNFMFKDPIDLNEIPASRLPLLFSMHPLNLWRYQVCKQADIVLLTFLCSERFDKEQIQKIFDYYEPRTIHDSSLSAAVHSIVACALGYGQNAYNYLKHAARMDLDDVNGNTFAGLHAACMGGAWMLIVNGYAGLRVFDGALHFRPMLHGEWNSYSFRLRYQSRLLEVRVEKGATYYRLLEGEPLSIEHCGKILQVTAAGVRAEIA